MRIKQNAWRMKIKEWMPELNIRDVNVRLYLNARGKTAYLNMSKVACSSLQRTLFESDQERRDFLFRMKELREAGLKKPDSWFIFKEGEEELAPTSIKGIEFSPEKGWVLAARHKGGGFEHKSISIDDINAHFIFTFVRNPFKRFVSFFQNKYERKKGVYVCRLNIFLWMKTASSFEDLAYKASKLPDFYLEPHSFPQSTSIEYFTARGGKMDFIGKFESLEKDFEPIRQKFGLLSLGHENKSRGEKKDWRDYYTPKTAKLIYQRYRKDFEMFGYEDEYPKLLDYLASKS